MQYQGKFTIGRKENIRYNLFVTGSRFLFMTVLVFVVIALMLGVTTYGQTKSIQQALIRALPMALGGAALFVVLNTVMMIFRINKAYKSKTAYEFTQDITIDGQGVHATSERGSALLPGRRSPRWPSTARRSICSSPNRRPTCCPSIR